MTKAKRKGSPTGQSATVVKRPLKPPAVDPDLIRFDRRTQVFLIILLCFLLVGTVFKLHGSAIGVWNRIFTNQRFDNGIIWGTARVIRQDEWSFATPMIVSQATTTPSFPVVNSRWGPGEVPLIIDMPARHWSMIVRPQFWAFFVLDLERGFAFYWNIKAVLLLGGMFLLLMLLTKNDFGISLFGALWVFFSAFMQWWYSGNSMPPDMLGGLALIVVSVHYILFSEIRWRIAAAAVLFVASCLNFALHFYPPLQVPLFYLGVSLILGSGLPRVLRGSEVRRHLNYRVACGAGAIVAVAVLLVVYYRDAITAIGIMQGTTYPGARILTGGDVTVAQLFSGFYGFFMSEDHFPAGWLNVCEASSFVLFFPIPMAALLWRRWRLKERLSGAEWGLLAYVVLVSLWLTVGAPRVVAAITGFARTHEARPLLGLGPASIILCCIFLSRSKSDLKVGMQGKLICAAAILVSVLLFSWNFNRVTNGFANAEQVVIVSAIVTAAGYLLVTRKRALFMACVLVPNVWAHSLVNPIAVGLSPVINTRLYHEVARISAQDPSVGWAVYGNHVTANLFKAAGAMVFNGTNYAPPLAKLRILDPSSKSNAIYNRFAQIALAPTLSSDVTFTLIAPDLYSIGIDPKSDRWQQLGVRYIVLPFPATDPAFLYRSQPVEAFPEAGLWVYRFAEAGGRQSVR